MVAQATTERQLTVLHVANKLVTPGQHHRLSQQALVNLIVTVAVTVIVVETVTVAETAMVEAPRSAAVEVGADAHGDPIVQVLNNARPRSLNAAKVASAMVVQ